MKLRTTAVLFSLLVGVLVLTGCPPKKKLAIEEKPKVEEITKSTEPVVAVEPEIEINQDWTEIPALQVIHFAFDSAVLDDSARSNLKKNVALIKKLPATVTVRVEGHCDVRGTVEYNIALGQRRATAVRSYYAISGIPKNRLETISFGHERPLCTQSTEECWAQNRRGMTKVKNTEAIKIKPEDLQ